MPVSKKKALRLVSKWLGNSIHTQFNLLSHLPNTGQEVKLEIGSPTKRRWSDTTSCFLNIRALCSRYAFVFQQVLGMEYLFTHMHAHPLTHTHQTSCSQHIIRGGCVSADCFHDPINETILCVYCFNEDGFNSTFVSMATPAVANMWR